MTEKVVERKVVIRTRRVKVIYYDYVVNSRTYWCRTEKVFDMVTVTVYTGQVKD